MLFGLQFFACNYVVTMMSLNGKVQFRECVNASEWREKKELHLHRVTENIRKCICVYICISGNVFV